MSLKNMKLIQAALVVLSVCSIQVQGYLLTEVDSQVAYSDQQGEVTQSDIAVKFEWSHGFDNGLNVKIIPKLLLSYDDDLNGTMQNRFERGDNYARLNGPVYEDENHRAELFEAYGDIWLGDTALRVGKQQVVWGQADGLKVLDVVNPQNYREFNLPDFEDSRIPTWMLNVQHPVGEDATLQFLVIPDLTFNELADSGSQFTITSPELAPQPVPGVLINLLDTQRPKDEVEAGVRWSAFIDGWDVTANYFHYYQDTAVVYRDLVGAAVLVTPTYEKSQLLGMSANTVVNNWVWKMEAGFIKDNYFIRDDLTQSGIQKSDEFASVFAFDYHGFSNLMVSYQLFFSQILDYNPAVIREESSVKHTLLFKQDAWNETLNLSLFTLFNADYEDGQARLKTNYQVNDVWSVYAGVDHFFGDELGPFGQFEESSRVYLGWQVAF